MLKRQERTMTSDTFKKIGDENFDDDTPGLTLYIENIEDAGKKKSKYSYCPECGKKLGIEEELFGFFLTCKDCGLGLGCNEKGEIDESNKKAWNEWNEQR